MESLREVSLISRVLFLPRHFDGVAFESAMGTAKVGYGAKEGIGSAVA